MSENTDDFEIDLGELPSTSDEVEIDLGPLGEESEPREEEITLADEPEDNEPEPQQDTDDATAEAVAKLREELEAKFGEWYVIHTYSGMENRVKQNLDSRATSLNMEDYIFETIVPTEEVVEVRNNTRKTVTRCVLPGYVLVRMELTDDSWATVRHTPSVTGFVGHGQTPRPAESGRGGQHADSFRRREGRRRGVNLRVAREEEGRGRRFRSRRLRDGDRWPLHWGARHDHRDQRQPAAAPGSRGDPGPRDPRRPGVQAGREGRLGSRPSETLEWRVALHPCPVL